MLGVDFSSNAITNVVSTVLYVNIFKSVPWRGFHVLPRYLGVNSVISCIQLIWFWYFYNVHYTTSSTSVCTSRGWLQTGGKYQLENISCDNTQKGYFVILFVLHVTLACTISLFCLIVHWLPTADNHIKHTVVRFAALEAVNTRISTWLRWTWP